MSGYKLKTPCVGRCSHCVGDYICRGCGRTVEQVRDWNTYSDEEKLRVMEELSQKAPKVT